MFPSLNRRPENRTNEKNPSPFFLCRDLIFFQLMVTVLAGMGIWFIQDILAGISAVIGGGIALLSTLCAACIAFQRGVFDSARSTVAALYWSELFKFLLCLGLFTIVFQWGKLRPMPMLWVFIVIQLVCFRILLVRVR